MRLFLFLIIFSDNNLIDYTNIREMYKKATRNEETCEALYELLKNDVSKNSSSSKSDFYGATLTLMANFSKNPVKKIMYSKQADYILDQSVIMDPKNFDARTLRILFNAKARWEMLYMAERWTFIGSMIQRLVTETTDSMDIWVKER